MPPRPDGSDRLTGDVRPDHPLHACVCADPSSETEVRRTSRQARRYCFKVVAECLFFDQRVSRPPTSGRSSAAVEGTDHPEGPSVCPEEECTTYPARPRDLREKSPGLG